MAEAVRPMLNDVTAAHGRSRHFFLALRVGFGRSRVDDLDGRVEGVGPAADGLAGAFFFRWRSAAQAGRLGGEQDGEFLN